MTCITARNAWASPNDSSSFAYRDYSSVAECIAHAVSRGYGHVQRCYCAEESIPEPPPTPPPPITEAPPIQAAPPNELSIFIPPVLEEWLPSTLKGKGEGMFIIFIIVGALLLFRR